MDLVEVLRNIGGATFLIQGIRWIYFTLGGE